MTVKPQGRRMSVAQAAEEADCHIETIRRAIRSKELLASRHPTKIGHPYEIASVDLAAFLTRRRER